MALSLTAFFTTLLAIISLAPLAKKIGLVDVPSGRKQHDEVIPLVGGLAILISLLVAWAIWGGSAETQVMAKDQNAAAVLLGCCSFLTIAGSLDDRFDLGIAIRVGSEVLVALIVIELLELRISSLGNLLGIGEMLMPPTVSYVFTVVAIFGLINAFNMLDGIDGLLATLVISTILCFHFLTATSPGPISIYILSALVAFLISNLRLSPSVPKSFLGDAGSKLLGFIVVCFLISAASGQFGGVKLIKPVTALYLVAVPLFDMVFTTLRRIARGISPLSADRSHIHHLFLALGFSHPRVLIMIIAINLSSAGIGLMLHRLQAPEYYQLGIFIGCFLLYSLLCSQAWLVAARVSDDNANNEREIQ